MELHHAEVPFFISDIRYRISDMKMLVSVGSGRLSRSVRLVSFIQKISRLVLSRARSSS
jgi:hypothetical protein